MPFVDRASYWYSALVPVINCVISYNMERRYNGTRLYLFTSQANIKIRSRSRTYERKHILNYSCNDKLLYFVWSIPCQLHYLFRPLVQKMPGWVPVVFAVSGGHTQYKPNHYDAILLMLALFVTDILFIDTCYNRTPWTTSVTITDAGPLACNLNQAIIVQ